MHLLVLACDSSRASAAKTQQCLAVFFRAYAPLSASVQRRLAAAALPAARRALAAGPSAAKSPAPQLLKYVLSLLQVGICHGTLPRLYVVQWLCVFLLASGCTDLHYRALQGEEVEPSIANWTNFLSCLYQRGQLYGADGCQG